MAGGSRAEQIKERLESLLSTFNASTTSKSIKSQQAIIKRYKSFSDSLISNNPREDKANELFTINGYDLDKSLYIFIKAEFPREAKQVFSDLKNRKFSIMVLAVKDIMMALIDKILSLEEVNQTYQDWKTEEEQLWDEFQDLPQESKYKKHSLFKEEAERELILTVNKLTKKLIYLDYHFINFPLALQSNFQDKALKLWKSDRKILETIVRRCDVPRKLEEKGVKQIDLHITPSRYGYLTMDDFKVFHFIFSNLIEERKDKSAPYLREKFRTNMYDLIRENRLQRTQTINFLSEEEQKSIRRKEAQFSGSYYTSMEGTLRRLDENRFKFIITFNDDAPTDEKHKEVKLSFLSILEWNARDTGEAVYSKYSTIIGALDPALKMLYDAPELDLDEMKKRSFLDIPAESNDDLLWRQRISTKQIKLTPLQERLLLILSKKKHTNFPKGFKQLGLYHSWYQIKESKLFAQLGIGDDSNSKNKARHQIKNFFKKTVADCGIIHEVAISRDKLGKRTGERIHSFYFLKIQSLIRDEKLNLIYRPNPIRKKS